MRKSLTSYRLLSVSAVVCIALAMPAHAQSPGSVAFVASQKSSEHNLGDLIGAAIATPGGEAVGDINYVLAEDGKVSTVVIGIGGMLGMGEKNIAVAFADLKPESTPQGEKRRFSIAATKDEIARAPEFRWLEKPMAVRIEEGLKSAAQKVKETARDLGEKAKESMKGSETPKKSP